MEEHAFRQLTITLFILFIGTSVGADYYLYQDYEQQVARVTEGYENKISIMKDTYDAEITALQETLGLTKEELAGSIAGVERQVKKTEKQSQELAEEIKGLEIEAGDFSAIAADAIKGVASIITDTGQGSGAIIRENGYIVTNHHVIDGITAMTVILHDGTQHAAAVIGIEEDNDLAVIKIDQDKLHDLNFVNSDRVKVGESVIALGNPGGLGFSVTEGIISQKDRVVQQRMVGLIQTDVAINPGNSGGPLLNKEGKIVGIVNAKIKGFEGIGFAIPSNYVNPTAEDIIEAHEGT